MKISIITGSYNHKKQLPKLYNSMKEKPPHEWIICDDGSSDGTWKLIQKYSKKHDWIHGHSQTNKGMRLARSLNQGIRHMTGELAFFVMGDSYLQKDTLEAIEESYVDGSAGCGVRHNVNESGKHHSWDWRIKEDLIGSVEKLKVKRKFRVMTGNSMILSKRHALEFMWDEAYEGYGFDDWDLFLKMEVLNIPLYLYNNVIINHIWHGDSGEESLESKKIFEERLHSSNV